MNPYFLRFSVLFLLAAMCLSCEEEVTIDLNAEDLIPIPRSVQVSNGSFLMTASTPINMLGDTSSIQPIVDYFNQQIALSTGFSLKARSKAGASNGINFFLNENENYENAQGYRIEIVKNNIVVSASSEVGLFYGVQTLLQMFPPQIYASSKQDIAWRVGTGELRDRPSYEYRGAMLDVARHFFTVDQVKQVIDYISMYKMNHLHLHLTDDQGWRIEIKSWPKLTEIGGQTQVGGGKGGFFTQEDYKEIVDYAASRYITIVPEIDMPGHTNSATASYGELRCDGVATELYTGIEVGFSTLCIDKEVTYTFVDDVIRELSEMTPGPYIHIGGDESHATEKGDYIAFMNKTQKIVDKYGKKAIGWDEIATSEMIEGSVVQFWNSADNARKGVVQGAKILLSPAKKTYLDMQYDSTSRIGLHWAAYIEIDSAYNWALNEYAKGIEGKDILGIETPLWTETAVNMEDIEYLMFPRLPALAEVGWSRNSRRDWESFSQRLAKHSEIWEIKGIDYYRSPKIDWELEDVED